MIYTLDPVKALPRVVHVLVAGANGAWCTVSKPRLSMTSEVRFRMLSLRNLFFRCVVLYTYSNSTKYYIVVCTYVWGMGQEITSHESTVVERCRAYNFPFYGIKL